MSDEPTRVLTAEEWQQYRDLIEARGYDWALGLALWPKSEIRHRRFEAFAENVRAIYETLTRSPLARKVWLALRYEHDDAAFLAWRMRDAEEEIQRLYLRLAPSYVDKARRVRQEKLQTLRPLRDELKEEVRRAGEQNREHVERCQRGLLALWAEQLVTAAPDVTEERWQQLQDTAYGFDALAEGIAAGCSLEWFKGELDRECLPHPAPPFFAIPQRAGLLEEAKKVCSVVERTIPLEQNRRAVEKLIRAAVEEMVVPDEQTVRERALLQKIRDLVKAGMRKTAAIEEACRWFEEEYGDKAPGRTKVYRLKDIHDMPW